jgi:hypothetical protein
MICEGVFVYCGERFAGLGDVGGPIEIIEDADFSENNHIEFHMFNPGDIARVGFACLDEEFCGWGREPVDPRIPNPLKDA